MNGREHYLNDLRIQAYNSFLSICSSKFLSILPNNTWTGIVIPVRKIPESP